MSLRKTRVLEQNKDQPLPQLFILDLYTVADSTIKALTEYTLEH